MSKSGCPRRPPLPNPQVYTSPRSVRATLWNFAAEISLMIEPLSESTLHGSFWICAFPVPS